MAKFASKTDQEKLLENFINNLSDVEVDDESDLGSSEEGISLFFWFQMIFWVVFAIFLR